MQNAPYNNDENIVSAQNNNFAPPASTAPQQEASEPQAVQPPQAVQQPQSAIPQGAVQYAPPPGYLPPQAPYGQGFAPQPGYYYYNGYYYPVGYNPPPAVPNFQQNPPYFVAGGQVNQPYPQGYPQYYQPIYSGYPPSYPQNPPVFQQILSPEEQQKELEKSIIRRSANHVGFGLLFLIVLSFGVGLFLGIYSAFTQPNEFFTSAEFNLFLNVVLTLFAFVGGAIYIIRAEKKSPLRFISYGPPKGGRLIATIMLGIGFCYVANLAVSFLQIIFEPIMPLQSVGIELPRGIWGFVLSTLAVAVAPAFFEEFMFRGAIMGSLLKYGKGFAIFASAALFALVHGNLVQIPFAFMVGIILGFAVVETDSIWTGVIIHFINNFISVCLDYATFNFGMEKVEIVYIVLMLVILAIGFIGLLLLCRKNKRLFLFSKTPHTTSFGEKLGAVCSSPTIIIFIVFCALEVVAAQAL